MFGTIRRHQAWLWWIIGGLTIISFVIFGPTNAKIGNALSGKGGKFGMVNGREITQKEVTEARAFVYMSQLLATGQWPDKDPNAKARGFNEARDIYYRIFLNEKVRQYGIEISQEAIDKRARQVLGAMQFDRFLNEMLKPEGFTAADFESYTRQQLGFEQLISVVGVNGKLVTPQEAEELYRKEHQDYFTSMALFSASNYMYRVTVTPAALSQFYSNRLQSYRLPPRIDVNYIKWNVTNYFTNAEAHLTNLNALVDANYVKYGTNLYRDTKDPKEIKTRLRADIIREAALHDAAMAAEGVFRQLNSLPKKDAAGFQAVAQTNGMKVMASPLFDESEGPEGMKTTQAFVRDAFALSDDEPFSGAVVCEDGAYLLAKNRSVPSETPSFSEVQAKVTADYKFAFAIQMARSAGLDFASAATNGLAKGKTFADIATENKVVAEVLPPFSLSTRDLPQEIEERVSFPLLRHAVFTTDIGHASDFISTQDGGFVVYVKERRPADEVQLRKELPAFIDYLRQVRFNEAFQLWLGVQLSRDPVFKATLDSTQPQMRGGSRG